MENSPQVIGIPHSNKHPDISEVLMYVEEHIKPGERIAFENPWSVERIEKEGATSRYKDYQFAHDFIQKLREKQACIFTVEDQELYQHSAHLIQWYMYEEREMLDADERWHELSIKRGIRHLQLAYQHQCSRLFVGSAHACELAMMGYTPVMYIPATSPREAVYRMEMQPHIERFGVDLTTGEWKEKIYPLISDMTLRSDDEEEC